MSIKLKGRKGLLNVIFAVLVIAGTAFYFIHYRSNSPIKSGKIGVIEIRDTVSSQVFGRWPLDEFEEFSLEFIHSVNKTPIRETFKIKDGKILLENVRFYSYGAGMNDPNEGLDLSIDGDAMILSGFNASFKEINLIVGTVSDHILFINNEIISLRELCGRNTQITIQYR